MLPLHMQVLCSKTIHGCSSKALFKRANRELPQFLSWQAQRKNQPTRNTLNVHLNTVTRCNTTPNFFPSTKPYSACVHR